MPTALVTGITGQDGYYLSELLLSKNYHVIATTRNANKAKASLTSDLMKRVHLIEWDLFDQNCILKILDEYRPTELYNCAAYSSGEGMFSDAVAIGEVNGVTVVRILEAIRITISVSAKHPAAKSSGNRLNPLSLRIRHFNHAAPMARQNFTLIQ